MDQDGGTLPSVVVKRILLPLMNQMLRSPAASRQSKSALPSPFKSRWPTIDQFEGTLPSPTVCKVELAFINHRARLPLASRQSTSLSPSPLKSWVYTGGCASNFVIWPPIRMLNFVAIVPPMKLLTSDCSVFNP